MKQFASAFAIAIVVSGCASTSQNRPVAPASPPPASGAAPASTAPGTAGAAATSAPIGLQHVRVPAESARKVVLKMTGSKVALEAKDWSGFKEEWRATFAEHAKDAGIAFAMRDDAAAPAPAAEDGTLLTVHVNDYRQVGIGARIFLGIMSGNAYIDANVAYSDLNNGQRFGEQAYNTTSSAWHGVFAKMTPQQVDAIASGVFGEIKAR